ncbi:hypothetical protein [Psychroserpens mesophilus]|uniref:hypothetical protein n=1 Tax=Psychroserpens mesophilus TaxID=325473 RepID=UPI00058DE8A2|nr:hypothetical protein [Psychroserpens mesophilus]
MGLTIARLLIDFGLVILIWMIQLIVYPSFKYLPKEELLKWHKKYTFRIACIVIPLMVLQLVIYGFQVVKIQTAYHILGLIIVVALWLITFSTFVPLHNAILNTTYSNKTLENLVRKNWDRTGLWTVLFILSLLEFIYNTY